MSQPTGLIAPESRRLLREARRMKREGFGQAASDLASASAQQKTMEPTISTFDDRNAARNISAQLQQADVQSRQAAGQEALQGRIGFAGSIEERAKNLQPGENLYEKTLTEAPKFGVTPSQLTSFFKKKNLSFATTPKTV